MSVWKVGIIGGGPGGLMTSFALEKWANDPLRVTLFEASDRLGGKILTPRFDRLRATYEAGAAEFYDYSHHDDDDPLKDLVQELGLPITRMEGASAVVRGRTVANLDDLREHFGSPAADALLAFDRLAKDAITPQEFYEANPEGLSDPLVQPGFDRLLAGIASPSACRYLEQFIHSDLAAEPHQTSVAYGLHNYLMNDPAYMELYGIAGGNEQLPRELARRLAADVRLNHRVLSVGRTTSGTLSVTTDHRGQLAEQSFDAVVVALPHDAFANVAFAGEQLAAVMADHHAEYDHPAHYLRVTVAFREKFWQGRLAGSFCMLDAFGGCCLYDESSRNPGSSQAVLGWLIGGDAAKTMSGRSDDELIHDVLDTLPTHLAHGRYLEMEGRVHRWVGAVNALPGGLHARTLDRRHRPDPAKHPHLFVVGDYLFDSTLNGVLDSAEYVARWIASLMADCPRVPA
ncbi:MAG: FAD-dependent oxidoreductase [Fimbriiglobus sp.]|nr:FAD-dependent oxidoreductase [Fimbriiglobus sp.]